MDKEIMKGSIDILILSLLVTKDMYGYEIAKNLKDKSNDLYTMSEGTLYPALKRLEKKDFLTSYWGDAETGGRRKYYNMTSEGKKELDHKLKEWHTLNNLIKKCSEGFAWMTLKAI